MPYRDLREKVFRLSEAYGLELPGDVESWLGNLFKAVVSRGLMSQDEADGHLSKLNSFMDNSRG